MLNNENPGLTAAPKTHGKSASGLPDSCSKVLHMAHNTSPLVSPEIEEPAWKQRAVERSTRAAKLRAEQKVQRFLDAAQAIITEKDNTDFTVQEVVDRSR